MLQELKSSFGIDQLINSISAGATFLALALTFITLVINSLKERKESKNRSEKTLSMMDFILEDNNETLREHLEKVQIIKEDTIKYFYLTRPVEKTEDAFRKWYDGLDKNKPIKFYTIYTGVKLENLRFDEYVETRIQKNYVILEIFRVLKTTGFVNDIKAYQRELKENLEKQHLNITSDSMEKIANKIGSLKACIEILESLIIKELLRISYLEKTRNETQINELLGRDMHELIQENYEKILGLEESLKATIKPLSDRGIK